jgi:hypothetical protein
MNEDEQVNAVLDGADALRTKYGRHTRRLVAAGHRVLRSGYEHVRHEYMGGSVWRMVCRRPGDRNFSFVDIHESQIANTARGSPRAVDTGLLSASVEAASLL